MFTFSVHRDLEFAINYGNFHFNDVFILICFSIGLYAEKCCPCGQSKLELPLKMDLKGIMMMDIVGESMDRKTFWELNILGLLPYPTRKTDFN